MRPTPQREATPELDAWVRQYADEAGANKILARRGVYELFMPGDDYFDFDVELIDVMYRAGLSRTATIGDIGCSFPYTLQLWRLYKHAGPLIGVEPNPEQFKGLAYWELENQDAANHEHSNTRKIDKIAGFYLHQAGLDTIDLHKGDANAIPIADGTADLISYMFSMYHVLKHKQSEAFEHAKSKLVTTPGKEGMLALATSGNANKAGIRRNEINIASFMSDLMGRKYEAPEPLNAGFTTEDACLELPRHFKYVYAKDVPTPIVVCDRYSIEVLMAAYRSLRDVYRNSDNEIPSEVVFEIALNSVVGPQIAAASMQKPLIVDGAERSLFIASDRQLYLPKDYKPVRTG